MKRYLLFAGDTYYPAGGWGDFVYQFADLEEAKLYASEKLNRRKWWHIVDLEIGEEVWSND